MGHKETRAYYDDTREYNYWTSVKQHEENLEELKIKVGNYNLEKDYQDDQNIKTYRHAVDQQNFQHEQAWRQYDEQNRIADEQLAYNRKAAQFSAKTLDDSTYERYLKLQFESANALLKHRSEQQKLRTGERELIQTHQKSTAQAAIASVERAAKTAAAVGRAKLGQAGQSNRKQVDKWLAISGREQAALLDMTNRENEQVGTKLYGIHYALSVAAQKRHYTELAQEKTIESIGRAYDRGTEEIMMKWEGADMQANHKRGLPPMKGPAPIMPDAMPRLDMGDGAWQGTFDTHGGVFSQGNVQTLGVFQPSAPGLDADFRARHGIKRSDFEEAPRDLWTRGPMFDYEKESGGAVGFGGTGARAGGISVGSVTSAVGGAAMAAASIATGVATASGMAASSAGIGFGFGSVSASVLGPIGMGIAAIGFLGSVFDWW